MSNTQLPKIKHLVLSGGAYLGFAELGALSELQEYDPTEMETYDATSIGAIFTVLFALGCSVQDVMDYFLERPWEQVIHEIYPKFTFDVISSMIEQAGLFDHDFIRIVMHPFLSIHFPDHIGTQFETLTLKHIYEYTKKDIYMYAVRIPNDETSLELVSLSHHTHPDLPVLVALQMTTAVPILFKPVDYRGHEYVDGGLMSNYPVQQCLDRGHSVNEIFSIYLKSMPTTETYGKYKLFEFQYKLLYRIVYQLRSFYQNKSVPNELIILCDHMSIQEGWEQIHSKEARQRMIEIGRKHAVLYREYKTRQG